MTQEEKELVFKDICARLPYGVRYRHLTWNDEHGEDYIAAKIYSINSDGYVKNCYDDETIYIDNVRPYLFPISNMPEEATREFIKTLDWIKTADGDSVSDFTFDSFDCLNKYHIDYRGLIEKGLAIDATGKNIY